MLQHRHDGIDGAIKEVRDATVDSGHSETMPTRRCETSDPPRWRVAAPDPPAGPLQQVGSGKSAAQIEVLGVAAWGRHRICRSGHDDGGAVAAQSRSAPGRFVAIDYAVMAPR